MVSFRGSPERMSLWGKLKAMNWGLLGLILVLAGIGFMALYSAAGGSVEPWAQRQMIRFVPALILAICIAMIDIRVWFWLVWPIWIAGLLLLVVVDLFGHTGMGAQRWINLGFMQLQPSELMKIAVIMALARFYHLLPETRLSFARGQRLRSFLWLLPPLGIMGAPILLVLMQPDLGTSLMIAMVGVSMMFLAGVWMGYFAIGAVVAAAAVPLFWMFGMKDYQKERVLTFLNPESDPLGAGYHITQSKIALGSGGFWGKGFMEGSQSRLNFLPEKQTDFIFTHLAEEWGFVGGIGLLLLLVVIVAYGYMIALNCRHKFGHLLALGLIVNFSVYAFINIGMVMGLMPVVGAPLPLVSYGGTSMMAAMISFGLIISVWIHRERTMPRGDFD